MGLYTLFWLAQVYAASISVGWLQNAVVRFLPENHTYQTQFMRFSFISVLIVGALSGFITIALGIGWGEKFQWAHLVWTVAILCCASLFSVFQNMLRGLFEQTQFSTSAVMLVATKIVLLFVLLPRAQDRVMTALMAMALSHPPVLFWQWSKLQNLRPQDSQTITKGFEGSLLRRSIIYGMPLTLSLFIITILQTGDRYILATLVSLKDVGIYAFWMTIGLQLGRGLYGFIFITINPRLFQLYRSDSYRAKRYVHRLTGLYVIIAAPLLTVFGLLLPPTLSWLKINPQYNPESHLIFYGVGMAFCLGLAQLCGKHFEFSGKTMAFVFASVIGVLVMVAGVFTLTPLWGIKGAAMSSCAGFTVYFVSIASMSGTWPKISDFLLAGLAVALFIMIYEMASDFFGNFVSFFLMSVLLALYCIANFRMMIKRK
jgi:O-antigen/teichoic acid export membrane protein